MKKKVSLCIAVLMLCAACASVTLDDPYLVPFPSDDPTPTPSQSAAPSSEEPSADPTEETEALEWTTEPILSSSEMPDDYNGLELPVKGATGYTTREIPLWASPGDRNAAQQAVSDWEYQQQLAQSSPEPSIDPLVDPAIDPGSVDPETAISTEPIPTPTPTPTVPEPSLTDGAMVMLPSGSPFTILEEDGEWWRIMWGQNEGWVEHRWCMINLPDVIPSMIFNATNGYSSVFVSCGKDIPGVTGQALYCGKKWNPRLGRDEFMMPVLYSMAINLAKAQRAALEEGNCIILYEGYRPYVTQRQVNSALSDMMSYDEEVKKAVSSPPWSISWFISTGISNHQNGYAVDVSLARIKNTEQAMTGAYRYLRVTEWEEYTMPTPVHELSSAAVTFTSPIGPNTSAWKSATYASSMNDCAMGLHRYCYSAGLSPLASEWWHFNDLAARQQILEHPGVGDFEITQCFSTIP